MEKEVEKALKERAVSVLKDAISKSTWDGTRLERLGSREMAVHYYAVAEAFAYALDKVEQS